MYSTYHFASAQELNTEIIETIKANYQSKPITIIVEDDEFGSELSEEMKTILDERLKDDDSKYLSSNESIALLNRKYGL